MTARFVPLLLASSLALCSRAGLADESDIARWRKDDDRLEKAVVVSMPRASIHELLAAISKQTRVQADAAPRNRAGDPIVCAYLRGAPLADAMDGLWALVSHRSAKWFWQRDGKPGEYTYRLVRPDSAYDYAAKVARRVQDMFEADSETMIAAAFLPAVDRAGALKGLKELQFTDNPDALIDSWCQSERKWAGLRLFAEAFPPRARKAMLQDGASATIPVSQLSPASKDFVLSEWRAADAHIGRPDGTFHPAPAPTSVLVVTSSHNHAAPSTYIELGPIGGYGHLGEVPLERATSKMLLSDWMLPGDAATDPAAAREVGKPLTPEERQVDPRRPLAPRLGQLADGARLSVLARLTDLNAGDPGAPASGETVAAYLARVAARPPNPIWKWRRRMLLLVDPRWFTVDADLPPAGLAERLRHAEGANGGVLPLRDFVSTVLALTPGQLTMLGEEVRAVSQTEGLHDLLAATVRSPLQLNALLSSDGVQVRPETLAAANVASPYLHGLPEGSEVTHLRFVRRAADPVTGAAVAFVGEARGADGRWLSFYSRPLPATGGR